MFRLLLLLLWCSGCNWREAGRHEDKDVDRGRVDAIVDDEGLLSETDKHDELDYKCN